MSHDTELSFWYRYENASKLFNTLQISPIVNMLCITRRPRKSFGQGGENAQTVAYTSRRARDLWSILQTRVVALIRLKKALQES